VASSLTLYMMARRLNWGKHRKAVDLERIFTPLRLDFHPTSTCSKPLGPRESCTIAVMITPAKLLASTRVGANNRQRYAGCSRRRQGSSPLRGSLLRVHRIGQSARRRNRQSPGPRSRLWERRAGYSQPPQAVEPASLGIVPDLSVVQFRTINHQRKFPSSSPREWPSCERYYRGPCPSRLACRWDAFSVLVSG
jgi:hypothetical protein